MEAASKEDEIQVVAMRVNDETFGIDVAHIHTVITPQPITPVPQTPDFVLGVTNLRGRILPVIDLRKRFNMPQSTSSDFRIAIVEIDEFMAGLVVDEVSDVLRIRTTDIEPPSRLLRSVDAEMILGIGRTTLGFRGKGSTEGFILLLDVKRVLTGGPIGAPGVQEPKAA